METSTKKPPLKGLIFSVLTILIFFSVIIVVNEYTLQNREELYLETVPVDPRDLLRGDYVVLRYAFENDPMLDEYVLANNVSEWTDLYISFLLDEWNKGSISSISEYRPDSGIFLKVNVENQSWGWLGLETGIWKYFVPEWTGRAIERVRWDMLVRLKVDTYGTAKIVDLFYKWEKINPKTFSID